MAAVFLASVILAAADPPARGWAELAALAPEARTAALREALARTPPGPRAAELRLVLGRTLLTLDRGPEAASVLADPLLTEHPLAEWALKWRWDAFAKDPARDKELETIQQRLFSAPGEPTFRLEAARALSDRALKAGRWAEALAPLETQLKASPLDAALAARLAEANERAGDAGRARQLARWLWTEMPAREETRGFFRAPAGRLGYVQALTPAERTRRLLRLEASGALDVLAAELPGWSPTTDADRVWKPLFAARLQERAGKSAEAVKAYRAILSPPEVAQLALERMARAIPEAGLSKKELEAAVRALGGLPAGGAARYRAFLVLFRWRLRLNDASGALYFATLALDPGRENGYEAAEYLYRSAWELWMAGKRKAAEGILRDLSSRLARDNDYRQSALFSLLQTGLLASEEAQRARDDLLAVSRYGYYGYRLRACGPPPPAASAPLSLAPLAPGPPGSHRAKSALLAALALDREAADELSAAAESGESPALFWALSQAAARGGDFARAIVAARRAFPGAFGEGGDSLPLEVWRAFYPLAHREALSDASKETGLPPLFLASVIRQESLWDREAVSRSGAVGLMQLMPGTAREVARKSGLPSPTDDLLRTPSWNIPAGSRYLKQVLDRSGGRVPLALASYNAGPGNVDKWLARPGNPRDEALFVESIPFRETRQYIRRISLNYWEYSRLYQDLRDAVPFVP